MYLPMFVIWGIWGYAIGESDSEFSEFPEPPIAHQEKNEAPKGFLAQNLIPKTF